MIIELEDERDEDQESDENLRYEFP